MTPGSCRTSEIAITAGSNCSATILRRRCLPAAERHSLRVGSLCGLASHLLQIPMGAKEKTRPGLGLRPGSAGKPEQKPVSVMPDSGIAVLRSGEASVIFCAMPNGLRGKGSHTHCDKLSIVFRLGPEEVFCDSGSRCYTRSAELRNLDRSTRAHNTLMSRWSRPEYRSHRSRVAFSMRQRSGCVADCDHRKMARRRCEHRIRAIPGLASSTRERYN